VTALVDEDLIEHPSSGCAAPRVEGKPTSVIRRYLRTPKTIWCAGCSNGIAMRALVDAILALDLDHDKVAVFAGIGCSGRVTSYLDFSTVHTTHGRALAFATGAKAADPSLQVIVVMGDGDCVAIGGNHLIHAARRNIDLTAVVFNNSIYGMTGGQMSPATFEGDRSTTSPYGNVEQAFDLCELAEAAGASYVARGTSYSYTKLAQVIAGGLAHRGFSFVEAMTSCPTYYGRQNDIAEPSGMLERQKERAVPVEKFDRDGPRLQERYPVGVLHHVERTEYTDAYGEVQRRACCADE
jgi:2-oxoglutarate ferredoxin oxidoreductase subunit beta